MAAAVALPRQASDANLPRVKRKPAPAVDIAVRYPSPDPNDPFAPLWVLRNRTSSALLGGPPVEVTQTRPRSPSRRTSYDLYPTVPIDAVQDVYVPQNGKLPPLSSRGRQRESHYRRRSQSVAVNSSMNAPVVFPNIQPSITSSGISDNHISRPPSLVRDSSNSDSSATDVDLHPPQSKVVSTCPSANGTRTRFARFRLPKRMNSTSLQASVPQSADAKRVRKASISPPVIAEHDGAYADLHRVATIDDIHSIKGSTTSTMPYSASDSATLTHTHPRAFPATSEGSSSQEFELGYYSQPESLPSHSYKSNSHSHPLPSSSSTPAGTLNRRKGSSLAHPLPPLPTSGSTQSHTSSSFVHISLPTPAPSFTHSASEHAYAFPRLAPRPPPPSFLRPGSRSNSKKPTQNQPHSSSSHPVQTEWVLPTAAQIAHAATLPIIAESGIRLSFGSLFADTRTMVIFIRHFWCPLCQDYMTSLTSLVKPGMLKASSSSASAVGSQKEEDVQLVVISNGAHGLITKYRQIFDMPFSMFTDPSLALYSALGMGRDGPSPPVRGSGLSARPGDHVHRMENGEKAHEIEHDGHKDTGYVKHGLMAGIAMVVMRALRVGMPVWEKGGDIGQLGGEFVFGPGLTCMYAHRMQSTKGHAPVVDVLRAAGVTLPPPTPSKTVASHSTKSPRIDSSTTTPVSRQGSGTRRRRESMRTMNTSVTWTTNHNGNKLMKRQSFGAMTREEEEKWMEDRKRDLQRLKEKKSFRRADCGGACGIRATECKDSQVTTDVDTGLGACGEVTLVERERSQLSGIGSSEDGTTGATEDHENSKPGVLLEAEADMEGVNQSEPQDGVTSACASDGLESIDRQEPST